MRNIQDLRTWIHFVEFVAALCGTAVPMMYSLFPWRSSLIGRLFMLQALSFAMALDLNALYIVWRPEHVLVMFWLDAIVFTTIAISTSALALLMWRLRYPPKKKV